jgi:RNA-binding protein YhbY
MARIEVTANVNVTEEDLAQWNHTATTDTGKAGIVEEMTNEVKETLGQWANDPSVKVEVFDDEEEEEGESSE